MNEERLAQIALHFIPGIGHMLVKQLVSYCGSAQGVLNAKKFKLLKIPGIGPVTANAILTHAPMRAAEAELNKCEKHNARLLLFSDVDFPQRLKHINNAPSILYVKGNVNFNANKVVSIVGTRKASSYGKETTRQLVADLTPHQPLIVSGLAYGVDIEAHKAALDHELATVGVMASGIDIIYPKVHTATAKNMIRHGALLSENTVGTQPDARKFPARNRIIAGMADVIIVIEAAAKGGALITAEIANSYSKDVFAIPGKVNDELSAGCNNLIRDNKAHLLQSISDIEYIMNWETDRKAEQQIPLDLSNFTEQQQLVITTLKSYGDTMPLDNLSWQTQIPASELASILLTLEFEGYVVSVPGKRFGLKRR